MQNYKAKKFIRAKKGETKYSFEFDYIDKTFVKAYLAGELVEATIDNHWLKLEEAPSEDGVFLVIQRETPTTQLTRWEDSSVLFAKDMNLEALQLLHIVEENIDRAIDIGFIVDNSDGKIDAQGRVIKNVGEATEPDEAVNLGKFLELQKEINTIVEKLSEDIDGFQVDVTAELQAMKQELLEELLKNEQELEKKLKEQEERLTAQMDDNIEIINEKLVELEETKQLIYDTRQFLLEELQKTKEEVNESLLLNQKETLQKVDAKLDSKTEEMDELIEQGKVIIEATSDIDERLQENHDYVDKRIKELSIDVFEDRVSTLEVESADKLSKSKGGTVTGSTNFTEALTALHFETNEVLPVGIRPEVNITKRWLENYGISTTNKVKGRKALHDVLRLSSDEFLVYTNSDFWTNTSLGPVTKTIAPNMFGDNNTNHGLPNNYFGSFFAFPTNAGIFQVITNGADYVYFKTQTNNYDFKKQPWYKIVNDSDLDALATLVQQNHTETVNRLETKENVGVAKGLVDALKAVSVTTDDRVEGVSKLGSILELKQSEAVMPPSITGAEFVNNKNGLTYARYASDGVSASGLPSNYMYVLNMPFRGVGELAQLGVSSDGDFYIRWWKSGDTNKARKWVKVGSSAPPLHRAFDVQVTSPSKVTLATLPRDWKKLYIRAKLNNFTYSTYIILNQPSCAAADLFASYPYDASKYIVEKAGYIDVNRSSNVVTALRCNGTILTGYYEL